MKGNKSKKALIVLIAIIMVFVFGIQCFATEIAEAETKATKITNENETENEQNNKIKYTKENPAKDGTIILNFTGLNLNKTNTYKYSLTVGNNEPEDDMWMDLTDFTNSSASIRLEGRMGKFTEIMAKSNYAKIWIKKSDEDNNLAQKIDVDLTLEAEEVVDIENADSMINGKYTGNNQSVRIMQLYAYKYNNIYKNYTGYLNNVSYKFAKVNDSEIVENWLNIKNSEGTDLSKVYSLVNSKMSIPTSGYTEATSEYLFSSKSITESEFEKRKDGLYVIYIQYRGEGYKTVYGYLIYDGMYDIATTLEEYKKNFDGNTDNNENKNETGTELTATVSYNPTESTTGIVTATIKTNKKVNKVDGWTLSDDGKTLTKTYLKNTTETLTLVDEDGKKKNVEVKISNITTKTGEDDGKDEGKDETVTPSKKIPQTGENYVIFVVAGVVVLAGVIGVIRYRKYKEI